MPAPDAYYLTHPQVNIDPAVPVPKWGLSDKGRARTESIASSGWISAITRIISSDETKAIETAEILARAGGLSLDILPNSGENDRSETGFLPPDQFENMADRFFGEPHISAEGWERAIDAQARIVAATRGVLNSTTKWPVLFVGHGAVGTLLKCQIAGRAISRSEDQIGGGGNVFAFNRAMDTLHFDWLPMERVGDHLKG